MEAKFKTKDVDDSHWEIGSSYLIRTVTMIYTGKLHKVTDKELVISDVAWIADTGRFSDAFITGELEEVEPMPGNVIIGRGAILDATIWSHDLPTEQK